MIVIFVKYFDYFTYYFGIYEYLIKKLYLT